MNMYLVLATLCCFVAAVILLAFGSTGEAMFAFFITGILQHLASESQADG